MLIPYCVQKHSHYRIMKELSQQDSDDIADGEEQAKDDVYNTAFSDEERARIQLTNVINENVWGRDCGEDTSDYIYILSYDEANTYVD